MITERPKSLQKCLCFHLDYAYTIYVFCLVLVPAKLILFVWFSYRGAVSLYQGNSNRGFQIKSGKSLYCHIHWWNNWQVRETIDSAFENWFYLVIDYNVINVMYTLHPVSEFRNIHLHDKLEILRFSVLCFAATCMYTCFEIFSSSQNLCLWVEIAGY